YRFRRHEICLEAEQRSGQSCHDSREYEHRQLVTVDWIALESRAQLVLADRHEYMPEWGTSDTQQDVSYDKRNKCDHDVVGKGVVEEYRPDRPAFEPTEAILSTGEFAPAKRHGVGQCGESQRQQREIDPTPPQNEDADDGRERRHECHR